MYIMLWVTIAITGGSGGGPASSEFASKEYCENALVVAKQNFYWFKGVCVPKGDVKE